MPVTFNKTTQRWVADYTDERGKRHRRGFETKREAKAHLLEAESQVRSGTFRSEAERITVGEMAQQFIAHSERRVAVKEIDQTTHLNYVNHIRRYISASEDLRSNQRPDLKGTYFPYALGQTKLKALRVAHVNRLAQELQALGLSNSMVRAVIGTLRRILALAIEYDWLAQNVAVGARRLRRRNDGLAESSSDDDSEDESDVFIPEKSEVAALCAHAPGKRGPVIWFAAATGVRSSEQRALTWRHVDLEKGTVRVRRRVNRFGQMGQPKSAAGRRTIPVAPGLLAALVEWKAITKFSGPDDLVFPNGKGNVEAHSNWRRRLFYPSWARAQQSDPQLADRKLWRWHDLRHFAISCWIEADVPLKQVQKWAGHSSAQMTLDRYGHLFRSVDHSAAMEKVEAGVWTPAR